MDQILDRQNVILAKRLLDDLIARQWDSLFVNLAISTLVDQLSNSLKVWFTEKV